MRNPYREIFRPPGTAGFAAAAFFARLPISMAPIGIVAMLSQTRGEYWLAGAVSAAYALTNALVAPAVSRLMDRRGQRAVAGPTAALAALAFAAMAAVSGRQWPVWPLFASALLAGAMPSVPAMVRARWSGIHAGRPELGTAFAFESVADELVYVAGASVSVALSVSLFPQAGMLACALLLAAGMAALLVQRGTEPAVRPAGEALRGSAIAQRPLQFVTVAMVFVGAIFATAEVTTVALTAEFGAPDRATLVIGFYATGSFLVGLAVGALQPTMLPRRQFLVALLALAATQVPLPFAGSVPTLALAIFASGLAVSPTFITAFALVQRSVPAAMLTEGVTWVATGMGVGMAFGSLAAGAVIDGFGASAGFRVSVACGFGALLVGALGQGALARADAPAPR